MGPELSHIQSLTELDPKALSEVHKAHYASIYRYALHRLNNEQHAEDASSEVFVRLVEALHAGKGPSKSVTGWLFQTASNVINDFFRKEYRQATHPLDPHEMSEIGGAQASTNPSLQDPTLRKALSGLTEAQQQVLALRFSADLSLADTAKVMNKSVNAVKALQFRAVSNLRDALKDEGE